MTDGMEALLQHLEVPGGYVLLDSQAGGGGEGGGTVREFELADGAGGFVALGC